MSCASIDLKAYFLGEASAGERASAEQHVAQCGACRAEYDRLRVTQAALLTVREEEIPRRIAFVSDKVFEPRWYHRLWQSGPRLTFAAAGLLSCAILVHAFYQPPAPAPVAAVVSPAEIESRVQEEVARRLDAVVKKAVADAGARQERHTAELLAAAEKRRLLEQRETMAAVETAFEQLNKRVNYLSRTRMASLESGQ
jgi:anti-sigma factor RsiW